MIPTKALKDIGLSDNEVEIYLLLLRNKEHLASEVAKQSKIARTNIYDILNKLISKGLVSYTIKSNRRYFKAINPEKLLDYLKEKEQNLKEVLPTLRGLYHPSKNKSEIGIYEGVEGLKSILNDVIKTGKNLVSFGASDRIKEYVPDFIIKRYLKNRERKKIVARQLFSKGTKILKTKNSYFRELPKEFSSPTTTVIYGDKVAIFIWESTPIVIRVKSKDLAKSYKKHFDLMWRFAGPKKGL